MNKGLVLVADDDSAIRTVVNQALTRAGYQVRVSSNLETLWNWVSGGEGDLVISDVAMPDGNVFEFLPRMKRSRPELPVVLMSAQNTFMTAIKASEHGAYEYLPKPFDLQEMISVVGRAMAEPQKARAPKKFDELGENMPLVGRSPAMQDVYRVLARLMQTDLTLMITGESGTGKELVARALHDFGKRRNGPFISINMAAIPQDMIETDLFGHEADPATNQQRFTGKFEQAEGGTLFLDEIGDMPMDAQTRLLSVLQQGTYTTVGGRRPTKTDVRIVASSNKDLRLLINQGLFREDLFYRLNVVPLRLPPLRERIEDIPDLVQHFILMAEKEGLSPKEVESSALTLLRNYSWPGNVRELENLIKRLAALHPQEVITSDILDAELNSAPIMFTDMNSEKLLQNMKLSSATEAYLSRYFSQFENELPPPGLYQRILREIEHPLITTSLAATEGNQIKAAELLGLNRNTLRKKIRDLGIQFVRSVR